MNTVRWRWWRWTVDRDVVIRVVEVRNSWAGWGGIGATQAAVRRPLLGRNMSMVAVIIR